MASGKGERLGTLGLSSVIRRSSEGDFARLARREAKSSAFGSLGLWTESVKGFAIEKTM